MLDALGVASAHAVGRSLGGGIAVLVDKVRHVLGRVVLCEAVAFPAPVGGGPNPMSERARARRAVWADRDAFVRTVGRKPPLSELAPDALGAYAPGVCATGRAARWSWLANPARRPPCSSCPQPRTARRPRRAYLPSLHATAVVVAGESSFLPLSMFEQQAARAGCPLHVVGGGHFLLQEDAGRAAKLVRALLVGE